MEPLSCQEIRELWVEYFTKKCPSIHQHIKSASLVPDNPTLLLNAAGMVQFVPIFVGTKPAPEPPRAVTIQKCARVGGKDSDLENIGRTARHHSFFEMLGNFSFGDYFKTEAIPWAWEFVTQELGLDKDKLYVSVFKGDEQNDFDQEAYDIWAKIIDEKRIWKMTRKDNFWGPPGATGPCGPCSEIYYEVDPLAKDFDDRYTEIWNLVFMQFNKDEKGKFTALKNKNIDTGAGLERIATILQGVNNTFETDELFSILENLASKLDIKYNSGNKEQDLYLKIITDHLRCACFLISDGVFPSNLGRGYVLRMIIRRAARFLYLLRNRADAFLYQISDSVVQAYHKTYPELVRNHNVIADTIMNEENQFAKTLERGLKRIDEMLDADKGVHSFGGELVFDLYSTYGLPVEITQDLAKEKGFEFSMEEYEIARDRHAEASGSGAFEKSVDSSSFVADILKEHGKTNFIGYNDNLEVKAKVLYATDHKVILDQTPFYAESGGQVADIGIIDSTQVLTVKSIEGVFIHTVGDSSIFSVGDEVNTLVDEDRREYIKKHHTSCHLLQAALRKVLGNNIQQMGSQVGPEYTRFDFNLDRSMTKDEIKQAEDLINSWIKKDFSVETKIMDYDDAVAAGALSFFEDKYDDEVRVLFIGNNDEKASVELCGGTHVEQLSEIKNIVIATEGSVASGIRRIKLLANTVADQFLEERAQASVEAQALEAQKTQEKEAQKALLNEEKKELLAKLNEVFESQESNGDLRISILNTNEHFAKEYSADSLKSFIEALVDKNKSSGNSFFIFSASSLDDKVIFYSACSDNLATKDSAYNAGHMVKEAAMICGGGGGGRPNFAQAGGKDISKIPEALKMVKTKTLGQEANA